jgi:tetratricopeptide (TPR) repeat protein
MGGGTSGGSAAIAAAPSPEEIARSAYNDGVRTVGKAKNLDADAATATDTARKLKALDKAQKAYRSALNQFQRAVNSNAGLYQAWNYIGFCQRHLGSYEAALTAYARALELNPDYHEAIEYRGEAYLGLNRTEDVKGAYLRLFRDARPLADELMTAMRRWLVDRHADAQGLNADALSAFDAWVAERATIAQQTASLAVGVSTVAGTDWK